MGGFFNMDGPFYRVGNMIADLVIISIVWIAMSIPIITVGASTTAVFYVATKRISNKEGYLLRDFFKSFKMNFIQSTAVWLVLVFALIIMYININLSKNLEFGNFILPLYVFFIIEFIIVSIFVFPLIARFQMSLKEIVKTAFFMANRHILTSVACLVVMAAVVLTIMVLPPVFIAGPGLYAFGASSLIMRVFKKYRPEIDTDEIENENIN